ncbi:hypothetical protein ABPG77_003524 [Micractinium sp. CCAP 211/92]
MGFEISEDTLLRVSGVGAVAYCAFAMAAPKEFTNTFMTAKAGHSDAAWRYMSICGATFGGEHLVLSAKDGNKDAKKDVLKVAGAGWLALGAHNAYNAHAGIQPKEIAVANAIGQTALGALCLWKGFGCDEK